MSKVSKVSPVGIALAASLVFGTAVPAQEPPQQSAELKKLKQFEGTWDAVMKAGESESKGTMVYKMDVGGLWLVADFQGELGGQKFSGKGLDSYDANKKKYVGVWVDSMSTSPMLIEGTYDKEGKVLTQTGEGPGPDGKPAKYKMTTEHKDKDNMFWTMYNVGADGKETPMFTISYKRRK